MNDPAGITVIRREGTYADRWFAVTMWTNAQGVFTVEAVEVEKLPTQKISEWTLFDSVDHAYARGQQLAKQIIDEWLARP